MSNDNHDLDERVDQFRLMELPGQPMMMHMGTHRLAQDLHAELKRVRARVAELKASAVVPDESKHHAVMQAQMWAQEARTQKAIVKQIGEIVGCANDWEMVEAVRDALSKGRAKRSPAAWLLRQKAEKLDEVAKLVLDAGDLATVASIYEGLLNNAASLRKAADEADKAGDGV
jgi:hypothetical protein